MSAPKRTMPSLRRRQVHPVFRVLAWLAWPYYVTVDALSDLRYGRDHRHNETVRLLDESRIGGPRIGL